MNYRSINDLNACIVASLHRLPRDLDLVVGIPRSGLLAANLIALHLNLPLTDLDGFIEGRLLGGGERLKTKRTPVDPFRPLKVLVVDDSLTSGSALKQCKERLKTAGLDQNVRYLCVFVDAWAISKVDYYFDVCPMPRVFEWNLFHHAILEKSCVDIDGVLCRDPSEEENDDGEKYRHFISNVPPLFIPSVKIGWVVTSRLEKYRALTEQWLGKAGARYGELVMMQYPDKQARMRANRYAEFKSEIYTSRGAELFLESSKKHAEDMVGITGKSVFCVDTREMLTPATVTALRHSATKAVERFQRLPRRLANRIRRVFSKNQVKI